MSQSKPIFKDFLSFFDSDEESQVDFSSASRGSVEVESGRYLHTRQLDALPTRLPETDPEQEFMDILFGKGHAFEEDNASELPPSISVGRVTGCARKQSAHRHAAAPYTKDKRARATTSNLDTHSCSTSAFPEPSIIMPLPFTAPTSRVSDLLVKMRKLPITCPYPNCTTTCFGLEELRGHLGMKKGTHGLSGQNSNKDTVATRCTLCTTYEGKSIMRHVLVHHSGIEVRCRQCGDEFMWKDQLKRHVKDTDTHHWVERKDMVYWDEVYTT